MNKGIFDILSAYFPLPCMVEKFRSIISVSLIPSVLSVKLDDNFQENAKTTKHTFCNNLYVVSPIDYCYPFIQLYK